MAETRTEQRQLDRPVSKPVPMAPGGTPNTLVLSGLALSTLLGKPGKWGFRGIAGAYVMCRQETRLGGLISGLRWVRFGRTTARGWVVELEADQLDQSVSEPAARRDLMLLLPDERYTLFWSCDREHFMHVKARIEAGELSLQQTPGALVFEFTRLSPRNLDDLDLIPWLLENGELDGHNHSILATHLLNPARGFVKRRLEPEPVAYIDATPPPLRALFLTEFMQWYALMAAKRSGANLVALQRACSLIAASESGARDAVMENMVAGSYAERGTPEYAMFDRYREYAWKCAAAETRRETFLTTLPTTLKQVVAQRPTKPDLLWEAAARALHAATQGGPAGPALHPGLDPTIQEAPEPARSNRRFKVLLTSELGLRLVRGYFDLYTLGGQLKKHTIPGRGALLPPLVREFEAEWERTRNQLLPETCRALLSRASYPELMVALLQHTGDAAWRLDLLERYLDACAWAEHPWWSSLAEPHEPAVDSLWKHLSPTVKWMSEVLKGTGKTLSGLVEARLSAYSLAFAEAHALLEALFRHEISLSGTTVEPAVHYLSRVSDKPGARPNFTARVNLRDGEMVITRDVPLPEAPHNEVRLKLLRLGANPEAEFAHGPPQSQHAYRLAMNIRIAYSKDLVVPADLAELKRRHTQLPKGFAACAEILNLARAAVTIADNLGRDAGLKEQLEPAWDLFKGTVALADTAQAVLKAMQRPFPVSSFTSKSALGGLKLASSVASGVDGAFKMYKGANILFSDEGDLEHELRHGRSLRAALQTSKGVLQIASGAAGIIGAIPATAGLAATPMGLVIAIGSGVVIAALDVALDATQEFEGHVHAFERALDKAEREELLDRRFRASEAVHAVCARVQQVI